MDELHEKYIIAQAVYKETTRAYHEYMATPWYQSRKKKRLGQYLDGIGDFHDRLHEDYMKEAKRNG